MQDKTKQTLKYYWNHAKRYKVALFFVYISVIGSAATNVTVPLFIKDFFNTITQIGDQEVITRDLFKILLLILGLEMLQWLFYRISTFCATYMDTRVSADLYNTCFKYLHKHSFSFFNNNFVGSLVKRVHRFANSYDGISDRITWNLLPLVVNLSVIIFVLYRSNRMLGLIITVWVILFLFISYLFAKYKLKYDIERSEADSAASAYVADTFTNNVNVKLFNGYARECEGFGAVTEKFRKLHSFTWNLNNIFEAVQAILAIGLEIGVLYYGIILWQKGQFTVGDFVLLQSYTMIVFMKIWDFGRVVRHVYQYLGDAEEMTDILNTPHEIIDKSKAKNLQLTVGKIEFANVTFKYNQTRSVLDKFNLAVKPKEKVAFVGPSGAGKSTIVKLILRMHDVEGGKILIDGQKITDVTLESLWATVSYVPQDPVLFHRSLMENIRYGRFDATDEEVYDAAKLAHCHEFIKDFPEGYDTFVGERGVKLSGGERQRVAIARAILRGAPILIMDEATSSLDSESEALIQDALANLMKNKTVITVAHRLSTIMKMDRIVVIGEGGITEEGTHSQLLKKRDGIYKNLWNIQAGGFIK